MTASFQTRSQEKLLESISDLEFLKEDLHKTSDIQNLDASDMLQIEKIAENIKNQRSAIALLLNKHGLGQDYQD